jgi:putative tryptophan/tyrosine transport system substrate-binding protein
MRRREFITGLAGAAALWPLSALAQQQGEIRRIGFLCSGLASEAFGKNITAAFTQGLRALGWKVDVNLHIDWRWYGADAMLAERQAAELIALKPDVLVAGGNPAVEKVRQQSKTIPVVFALVSDPVGMGYVASVARPGGNITGFSSYDPPIYTKQLQMLTKITPPARTVAILYNPETAPYASRMVRVMEDVAKSIGVAVRDAPCHEHRDQSGDGRTCPGWRRWAAGSGRRIQPRASRNNCGPRPRIQHSERRQYASNYRDRRAYVIRHRLS